MTPSERLHRLHERCARKVAIEPMRQPSIVTGLQMVVRDLAALGAVLLFVIAFGAIAIGLGG